MNGRGFARLLAVAMAAAPAAASSLAEDPRVAQRLELARSWLEAQRAYDRIPGVSAAIVHDQQVLRSGGFGEADPGARRNADADTIYSIRTGTRRRIS